MIGLYAIERGPDGYPKLVPPEPGRTYTDFEMFDRRAYLLGITNPVTVARLWAEEQKKVNGGDQA